MFLQCLNVAIMSLNASVSRSLVHRAADSAGADSGDPADGIRGQCRIGGTQQAQVIRGRAHLRGRPGRSGGSERNQVINNNVLDAKLK